MLWSLRECVTTEIPGFDLAWLPSGIPPSIKPFYRKNRVGLEVGTIVGSIPLRNGDTLQILPRVGNANFIRMLVESETTYENHSNDRDETVGYSYSEEISMAGLVARPFARTLLEVESGSLRFEWRKHLATAEVAAGELEVLQTGIALATYREKPFVFTRKTRVVEIAENIVLATAAEMVLRSHAKLLSGSEIQFLSTFARRFSTGTLNNRVTSEIKGRLAAGQYDGARGYYAQALKLAFIILGESGFKQGNKEELKAEPVLFNSASIFEAYVRQQLKLQYQKKGCNVRKGFFPPLALFKEGSVLLDPDIVITKNDSLLLVGDVKYKTQGVVASDQYQAHVYAQRAAQKYFVFFSADETATRAEATRRSSFLEVEVFEVKLPLAHLPVATAALHSLELLVPAFHPQ